MDIESLIQSVIKNPNDMETRLLLADCLEQVGDPRAEMIRIQFQLKKLEKSSSKWAKLRKRELKLIRTHGSLAPVPDEVKILAYEGGFVDAIMTTVTRFVRLQEKIFSKCPVRAVRIKSSGKRFEDIKDSPFLKQLTRLELQNNKADLADMKQLLGTSKLANLKSLSIRDSELEPGAANVIANAEHFTGLEELELAYYQLNDMEVEAIAASSKLKSLKRLSLGGHISSRGLFALGQSPYLTGLQTLAVRGDFSSVGIQEVQQGTLKNLETLEINSYRGDMTEGFDVEPALPKLTRLVAYNSLDDRSIRDICLNNPNLLELEVPMNQLTDGAMAHLADYPQLANLRRLTLTSNRISLAGVEALAASPYWNKKTKLYLRGNDISTSEITTLKETYGKTFGNFGRELSYWYYA